MIGLECVEEGSVRMLNESTWCVTERHDFLLEIIVQLVDRKDSNTLAVSSKFKY